MPTYVTLATDSNDLFEEMMEMDSEEFFERTKVTVETHGGEILD